MDKKRANAKQTRLLWVDLEMTGLDPVEDRILEVAAIVTDWNFTELASYEAAVAVGPRLVERRMLKGPAAEFWESVPETRDALIAQNKQEGRSGRSVENELLAFVSDHFDSEAPVVLAGNSIHMDRRFIEREWPRLNAKLHYRMLDVSAWKLVFEARFRRKFAKREAHRALDDIRGSIEELQYYLKRVKK
ncbi:TPA: oligoribonuclease [Candidatus Saccharibacteria bacterium]|nr:oligoribonuclease [Candidatus Saccharibacteria bacterium]|tara:strand:- start:2115 stop:2684 length:570 start_codon:yes stop_codon:yes gene_type:complete